jgi:hypothetical protein
MARSLGAVRRGQSRRLSAESYSAERSTLIESLLRSRPEQHFELAFIRDCIDENLELREIEDVAVDAGLSFFSARGDAASEAHLNGASCTNVAADRRSRGPDPFAPTRNRC